MRSNSEMPTRAELADEQPTAAHPRLEDGDLTAAAEPLTLGRYTLGKRLGAGGFATVYAAHDERLDRPVAIKILPRERVIHSRFEREARAAARLHHPGIVTLFEAAVDDDGAYLVSELVKGTTLDQALARGSLSDRGILEVAVALADALEHAHSHDVVHRDVKPQNVLIPAGRRGSPAGGIAAAKLTDFGVAHVVGGDTLTRTGDVIGTLAYMSPEQAEGRNTGPASDLYSLALLTYEALTGVNPVADSLRQGRNRRLGAYLPPIRRQRADLPRPLGAAIDQALRPRPSERGSVVDFQIALADCLALVDDVPGVVAPARTIAVTRRLEDDGRAATRRLGGDRPGPEWSPEPRSRRVPAAEPTARSRTGTLALAPGGLLMLALGCVAVGLGALGLAGAWPALVSQTIRGFWRRAIVAAAGVAWLGLAALVTPQTFYYGLGDVTLAALAPVGVLAALWAATGAVSPWLIRGAHALVDLLLVTAVAVLLAVAVAGAGLEHLTGLVPGAVIGWLIAAHRPLVAVIRAAIARRRLP